MVRTLPAAQRYTAHIGTSGWWFYAALLVLVELLARLTGLQMLALAALSLIAPGFALSGLLPRPIRDRAFTRACLAPALGIAVTSVALTSAARLGLPLTEFSVRAIVIVLVAAGLLVGRDVPRRAHGAGDTAGDRAARDASSERTAGRRTPRADDDGWRGWLLDGALLGAAGALAFVLAWRVIGTLPVPGDDWAKYLLYADEIRRNGSLLLDNALWMGGRPFSEDPGIPSLQGAALIMTGEPAGALVRTILVLSMLQVVGVYAVTRAWFGPVGAFAAAATLAVLPASQNILGWHGLANVGALVIVVLILAQLGAWLAGTLDRRGELGLAITLLGVAAAHRFTTLFVAATILLVLAAALAFGPRRQLLLATGRTLLAAVALGIPLILDLQVRADNAGGTLPYTSYLATKLDLEMALRDLTLVASGLAILLTLWLLVRRQLPRAAWPALALGVACIVLAYGWAFQLPLYYSRVTFFLPIPIALLVGAGIGTLAARWSARAGGAGGGGQAASGSSATARRTPGAGAIAVLASAGALGGAVLGFEAVQAWRQAEEVRQYYGFASPQSLEALDGLAARLEPNEIVATDRCWSFLATWLLYTRTYPALEEQDIQPKAELVIARQSAAILRGTTEGRELMRTLPVRYAVLDPTCPVNGRRFFPPGQPIYAGARLAIVELNPDRKNPPAPDRPRDSTR